MSGQSSVGTSGVYEAGDQRNYKDADKPENQAVPYEEGKPNSHQDNDSSKFFSWSHCPRGEKTSLSLSLSLSIEIPTSVSVSILSGLSKAPPLTTSSLSLSSPTEDQRSIANRLAAADSTNDNSSGKTKDAETKAGEIDPTLPARMHGNEPSRGAKIDKKIEDEEAELLRRKDEAKKQSKAAAK